MPTTTLTPAAEGTDTAWALGAGATKIAAVDPADDDATTFISATTNVSQGFEMDSLPAEAGTVQSHTTKRRMSQAAGTGDSNTFILLSAVYSHGATIDDPPAWTTRLTNDIAKPGGGTWKVADINASQVGVRATGQESAPEKRCTTISWDVTWDPAPGGFAIFVGALIGGAIGSAVGLHEIPKLAAYFAHITGRKHRILPCEFEALWWELSLPRRRYAF